VPSPVKSPLTRAPRLCSPPPPSSADNLEAGTSATFGPHVFANTVLSASRFASTTVIICFGTRPCDCVTADMGQYQLSLRNLQQLLGRKLLADFPASSHSRRALTRCIFKCGSRSTAGSRRRIARNVFVPTHDSSPSGSVTVAEEVELQTTKCSANPSRLYSKALYLALGV
jgi:hypothetical protein